jgi:apolipoprotein N-acyltransferase
MATSTQPLTKLDLSLPIALMITGTLFSGFVILLMLQILHLDWVGIFYDIFLYIFVLPVGVALFAIGLLIGVKRLIVFKVANKRI